MCDLFGGRFQHFMSCPSYSNIFLDLNWIDIYEDDLEKQNIIAVEVYRRKQIQKTKLPHQLASLLQDPVKL